VSVNKTGHHCNDNKAQHNACAGTVGAKVEPGKKRQLDK